MRLEINNVTKDKINTKILKKGAVVFSRRMKLNNKAVSVAFVSGQRIRSLNKRYRKINKVTDILSFAGEGEFLGELIICYPQIRRQAKQAGNKIKDELLFIFIHGLLHLVSYDDTTKKGYKEMMELGKKISKSII
ncbi:rRNA maturation RNase YbeY [Candidatus Falkowbacteria bacterium CG10_big_fil_rev_8_21_14_0_10_43_11]|uniref:Endoribonuclease YbeY n=1 Tax=Candidatus Falkowbacteria bacterium CG10_big_fil_rev_8_21_14_0_10_43_11 TaxID=1974568 RepID=A0A2M6WM99_9BACT|nr:MAG: rRNA maturation RNase YbeY [Candidatus Falkowbacteria bacterium CG10_big_fil_rev_8_21_14_0_10_43_11]